MTIGDIIKEYLEENKLDGLCNSDSHCACLKDDLFPCSDPSMHGREAGVKVDCRGRCDEGCDWHIVPKEPDSGSQ